jgi:hypothetical protein
MHYMVPIDVAAATANVACQVHSESDPKTDSKKSFASMYFAMSTADLANVRRLPVSLEQGNCLLCWYGNRTRDTQIRSLVL